MRPATLFRYTPPTFTLPYLPHPPPYRLHLANLPTPLHTFIPSSSSSTKQHNILPHNATLLIKRDDATGGIELGGNKIRKLEFLLADALSSPSSNEYYDTVVTIGGIQSNHCRATAAACRMVGLTPHLILRSKQLLEEDDLLTGNLLVDRMVGATIQRATPGEYGRVGQKGLVDVVVENLKREGKRPYGIPVGGSNGLGTWGYIEAVKELLHQLTDESYENSKVDHVVFATGSGGTATGIVLGFLMGMASMDDDIPKLHAVGVCDDPDYFYKTMVDIAMEMGFRGDEFIEIAAAAAEDDDVASSLEDLFRRIVTVHQGKGRGYAVSTADELDFVTQFSVATGIVLDPVYTGKAMYHFVTTVMMEEDDEEFRDKTVLFWHTGGALGMYDKERELVEETGLLKRLSKVDKLDVYGSLKRKDNLDS